MLERRVHSKFGEPGNPVVLYVSPLLEHGGIGSDPCADGMGSGGASRGVRHGFTTRLGGVSTGPCKSLNLGNVQLPVPRLRRWVATIGASRVSRGVLRRIQRFYAKVLTSRFGYLLRGWIGTLVSSWMQRLFQAQQGSGKVGIDPQENQAVNHRRAFEAAGIDPYLSLCRVHQVHGAVVYRVSRGAPHDPHAKADAIVSDDPSRIISVRVADCVPVLLSSGNGAIVAAVHAGWRGVVAGVLPSTVRSMTTESEHGVLPSDLVAAIGPCIGTDAFEVGPEVVAEFAKVFGQAGIESLVRPGKLDRHHIDLRAAVKRQLLDAGLLEANIDTTDRCTHRDEAEFFSHRRDNGVTGRMIAFIASRQPLRAGADGRRDERTGEAASVVVVGGASTEIASSQLPG